MRTRIIVTSSILLCGCQALDEEIDPDGEEGAWNECQPGDDRFFEMQSGEPCTFSGGCGMFDDVDPEAELLGRWVDCVNGALSVTESLRVDEPAPSEDVVWEDCSALDGGRSGEACEGSFVCFEPESSGCLGKVSCGTHPSSSYPEVLVRYLLCDDADPAADPSATTHSNCDSASDARPLDSCDSGGFLCNQEAMSEPYETVPPCEPEAAFCPEPNDTYDLLWCDQGKLHVFHDDHLVAGIILEQFD